MCTNDSKKYYGKDVLFGSLIATVLSTLRNGISWVFISCSTNRMVLERDIISLLISSICRLIIRLLWSSSAFKAESLAASCSFRKRWRASNSSLICVSVCSAWFCKVTWLKGNRCLHTQLFGTVKVTWCTDGNDSTLTCSAISSQSTFAFLYSCSFSFKGSSAFFSSSYKVSDRASTL